MRLVSVLIGLSALLIGLSAVLVGCGGDSAALPADFSADVTVERNQTVKVEGTDLEISLSSVSKAILDTTEIEFADIELSGIGDAVSTTLETSGEADVVDYDGFRIRLRSASARGDDSTAHFDVTLSSAE